MDALRDAIPGILAVLAVVMDVLAGAHALLNKRDNRAAVGWIGVILALPFAGAILYWVLGINRVQRRATALYRDYVRRPRPRPRQAGRIVLGEHSLAELCEVLDRVTSFPVIGGNRVTALENGDAAYPAMIAAIDAAQRSVALQTYIFDRGRVGDEFIDALGRAAARGVDVRVLVDAVGARYSFPTVIPALRRQGVRAALFNRNTFPWRWTYANLRSHRKILVVDGHVGFTGGLNIRAGHVLADDPPHPIVDVHFKIEGPVICQMQVAFAEDWAFTTREQLVGDQWFPAIDAAGDMVCRGIIDGPDSDLDKLRWAVFGALASARRRVRIVTPYFLPEGDLVAAIRVAVLRGVEVEIVLPEHNNQILVKWASTAVLPQIITDGCRVWETPGPFDHSKIFVVDDGWVLIGSANLDPRSLRLNFEFNIECYSETLAAQMHALIDRKIADATLVTHQRLESRSLPTRLRDGFARLFIPYI
ncbi:MAG: cardiolipin synthase [Deltaproteobacteria bacterium]|nr:MAG: cardiolipin synthase [Deltaproteobacteria bacterium]